MVIILKKYTIITIIVLGLVLGFFTGNYIYKINQLKADNEEIGMEELIEDECTAIAEYSVKEDLIKVNNAEEKTSPNCKIILKMYYKECGHLLEKTKTIEEMNVNLTEQELKEKFQDWELQKFTPTEIVLYKEFDGFCKEHYVLKEKDGNIAIYILDENNNETYIETTEVSTQYLEEDDLNKIKDGIYIYSKKELNKVLEDFE